MGIFDFLKQDYNTCKVCGEQISSNFEICNDCKSIEGSVLRVHRDEIEDIGIVTHYKGKPFTGILYNYPCPGFEEYECQMKNGLKDGFHKVFRRQSGGYVLSEYKDDIQIGTEKTFNKEDELIREITLKEVKKERDKWNQVMEEMKNELQEEMRKKNVVQKKTFKEWWNEHEKEISEKISKIVEEEIDELREGHKEGWFKDEHFTEYGNTWDNLVSNVVPQNLGTMGQRINDLIDDYENKFGHEINDESLFTGFEETYVLFQEEFLYQISTYSENK